MVRFASFLGGSSNHGHDIVEMKFVNLVLDNFAKMKDDVLQKVDDTSKYEEN